MDVCVWFNSLSYVMWAEVIITICILVCSDISNIFSMIDPLCVYVTRLFTWNSYVGNFHMIFTQIFFDYSIVKNSFFWNNFTLRKQFKARHFFSHYDWDKLIIFSKYKVQKCCYLSKQQKKKMWITSYDNIFYMYLPVIICDTSYCSIPSTEIISYARTT